MLKCYFFTIIFTDNVKNNKRGGASCLFGSFTFKLRIPAVLSERNKDGIVRYHRKYAVSITRSDLVTWLGARLMFLLPLAFEIAHKEESTNISEVLDTKIAQTEDKSLPFWNGKIILLKKVTNLSRMGRGET